MASIQEKVYEIIEVFAKEKRLHRREAEMAILEYLKRLTKRRLLHLIVPGQGKV